jgi:hypothetical protein
MRSVAAVAFRAGGTVVTRRPSRIRCFVLALVAGFTAVDLLTARPPAAKAREPSPLFASNEGDDTLTVIDAASLWILGIIPVGPQPHNLTAPRGGPGLVATQGGDEVSVVDPSALRSTVRIRFGAVPHDVASGDGSRRRTSVLGTTASGGFVNGGGGAPSTHR